MRFPLRLSADLAFSFARRALRGGRRIPVVLPVSYFDETPSADLLPISLEQCADMVSRANPRIVWVTGPEPLLHPHAGRISRHIADAGRRVFLHTHGDLLRRRIHEFRPRSDFFFALQFDGFGAAHDRRSAAMGQFAAAVEGLRVAKLSGFLVCARVSLHADTELDELKQLRATLDSLDIDGLFLSRADSVLPAFARDAQSLARIAPSTRWNDLGKLVDSALSLRSPLAPARNEEHTMRFPRPSPEAAEESAPLT